MNFPLFMYCMCEASYLIVSYLMFTLLYDNIFVNFSTKWGRRVARCCKNRPLYPIAALDVLTVQIFFLSEYRISIITSHSDRLGVNEDLVEI